jgi:exodeoxyribonuclease VII large subunit
LVLTVGELTRQIKDLLELEYPRVCVRGEISGFRGRNPSGHLYFSLKDETACLDVKIWSSVAQRMKFQLRDGMSVIAEGSIDVYEPRGRYSLIVQRIEPAGEGALALAFQQLKERLAAEGLIGERRTRPPRAIPFLPRRIGVVTSIHGAALHDFLRVLHQRHPRLPVLICDARVQGDGSVSDVVRALRRLARAKVDVIVITRGGGSIEDLWTFNEEVVARAIYACPVPVVSAIGHEVDFTIADFVADFRAPTPSAAAEKLAPVLSDLELSMQATRSRLRKAMEQRILAHRHRLQRQAARLADPRRILGHRRLQLSDRLDALARILRRSLQRHRRELVDARMALYQVSPQRRVVRDQRRLAGYHARIRERQQRRIAEEQRRFHTLEARLEAMSPLTVMARGYSITLRKADGRVVRSAAAVKVGEEVLIKLADAGVKTLEDCEEVSARVTETSAKKNVGGPAGDH